jgi:hypothetical protein
LALCEGGRIEGVLGHGTCTMQRRGVVSSQ